METTEKKSTKPRRRVQKRALDTRDNIISAAVHQFAKYGFEGTSTRSVADAAGVRQSLVVYHFKTKDELWRQTIHKLNQARRDKLVARLRGLRGVDDATKLRLVLEDFVRFSAEHPEFHALMANVGKEPGELLDWIVKDTLDQQFATTAELIESAQKQGKFVQGDPIHLQYLFIGMVTRVFMLAAEAEVVMGRSPFEPEFIEDHIKICLGLFFTEKNAG